MKKIKVNLGERSYDIEIGKGNLFKTDFRKFKASKYAIITDSVVRKLFGEDLKKLLKKQGLRADIFEIPAGEKSKTWKTAGDLGRALARKQYDKNSLIISLGGGVVGDLAGFVASFYKRGINYIHIPTTLLAQVDSSIGGKTGVDISEGKNLFGCIYQPKAVLIDIKLIQGMPERGINDGLAEVIKYGMIWDKNLFEYVEKNISKRTEAFYLKIIEKSCRIKAKIISQDEKESDLRKIFNYGHTIGHAIEVVKDFKLNHGEAVVLGMMYEGAMAVKLGILSRKDLERQNNLLQKIVIPVNLNGLADKMIKIMRSDKKNQKDKIYFVLPKSIGKAEKINGKISFPVSEAIIKNVLNHVKIN